MRAWLTPDSALFENPLDCRTLTIPGDLWLYVQGALELLTKEYNWQQFGTATPEEASQFFMGILDDFSNSECASSGMIVNPASYTLLFNGSGTTATDIDILQSALPAEAQGCKGLLITIRWQAGKHLLTRLSTIGGYGIATTSMQDEANDSYVQLILPMDETGGRVRVDAVGGPGSWNFVIYLQGWFF